MLYQKLWNKFDWSKLNIAQNRANDIYERTYFAFCVNYQRFVLILLMECKISYNTMGCSKSVHIEAADGC